MPVETETLKVGLRFRRGDARTLRGIYDAARAADVPGDLGLYLEAANAAERREPLVVECSHVDEVHEMASLLAGLGIRRPAVEEIAQD